MLYILGAISSPFCGILVDKTGRNGIYGVVSIFLTIVGHSLLAFTFSSPFIGMIIIGLSYSMMASAVWPMVSQLVPENQLATAYGMWA
jgi:MFS family permease